MKLKVKNKKSKSYLNNRDRRVSEMAKLFDEIEKITKGLDFSGIDYKALVEYGRK